eukprot:SAG22_NODE_4974_length_1118_cov_2.006869_2_plen_68_part_00
MADRSALTSAEQISLVGSSMLTGKASDDALAAAAPAAPAADLGGMPWDKFRYGPAALRVPTLTDFIN